MMKKANSRKSWCFWLWVLPAFEPFSSKSSSSSWLRWFRFRVTFYGAEFWGSPKYKCWPLVFISEPSTCPSTPSRVFGASRRTWWSSWSCINNAWTVLKGEGGYNGDMAIQNLGIGVGSHKKTGSIPKLPVTSLKFGTSSEFFWVNEMSSHVFSHTSRSQLHSVLVVAKPWKER